VRSFASQGQASSVNRFRFDDVAYCVASYRVLAIKPCELNWELNCVYLLPTCYVAVLYLWLYVTMKTHHDFNGRKLFFVQFKHPLRDQCKSVCWPSYVGQLMLAVVCWPSHTSA
jgi:hypothetical protein